MSAFQLASKRKISYLISNNGLIFFITIQRIKVKLLEGHSLKSEMSDIIMKAI